MSREGIGALVELARLVRDRDLARLGAAAQEVHSLRAEIATLDAALGARRDALRQAGGMDMALLSGADQRWRALVERRRRALNQTLAIAAARQQEAHHEAARAVGRLSALDHLARKEGKRP